MIESFGSNMIEQFAESDFVMVMDKALPLSNAGKIILAQPYDTSTVGRRLFSLAAYLVLKGNASFIAMGGGGGAAVDLELR
eukprot:gene17144-15250_t